MQWLVEKPSGPEDPNDVSMKMVHKAIRSALSEGVQIKIINRLWTICAGDRWEFLYRLLEIRRAARRH
jgi:hypothetical protein